ncbi:MAG: hypothetical protein KC416_10415 [Myxococcales bacterium]|nr:hypothetical protein [Myxococcales bacterium]
MPLVTRTSAALLRERAVGRLRSLFLIDWSEFALDPCDIAFEDGDPLRVFAHHAGRLRALERLQIGLFPGDRGPLWGFCQGVGPALPEIPTLRRLHLCGERGWELLPKAGHPRLEALVLHVAEPDDEPLDALEEGSFPALRSVDLWAGAVLGEMLCERSFDAVLAGSGLPALTSLCLRGIDDAAVIDALAAAEGLGRLREVRITDAPELGDEALEALCDAAWIGELARVDLRGSGASEALARALAARGPEVLVDRVA